MVAHAREEICLMILIKLQQVIYVSELFVVNLPPCDYHWDSLVISQRWFKLWLDAGSMSPDYITRPQWVNSLWYLILEQICREQHIPNKYFTYLTVQFIVYWSFQLTEGHFAGDI